VGLRFSGFGAGMEELLSSPSRLSPASADAPLLNKLRPTVS